MSIGHIIDERYVLLEKIGEGAMGEVYRALDTTTESSVAVKVLKDSTTSPDILTRFQREGEALRQLNHPNIVKVLATYDPTPKEHYIVMEYVSGGSLRDLLRKGRLPVEQVLRIALELADALTRAHLLNIVHRDIKPANILIAPDGTPRLTDFGIAHVGNSTRMTGTGAIVGTIDYISPEACRGEPIDHRADIWAFGVLLYEMLMGAAPFKGDNFAAVLSAILHQPIPQITRDDVPADLTDLIHAMLRKDPAERVSSVRQVGADLEAILRGEKTTTHGSAATEDESTASLSSFATPKNNLPTQATPFIGRADELAEIAKLLADPECRLLTLLGPGGMGKTRLSLEAAAAQVGNFGDGVFFVALAPLVTADLIVPAIAEATGYEFFGSEDNKTQLICFLREKQMLLVLDNFEHLVDGVGLVAEILESAPQVKILATSRQRLNLHGEWIFGVEGMSFPEWLSPAELEQYEAIQLFLQSARRVQPGFGLNDANKDAVITICQLVQGMPLGIELAAAWVEMLTLEEIAGEIQANIDFLETELRDIPERHRSIRAVFEYSWNLLGEDERAVFAKLSFFKGGFTRDAAEKVTETNLRALTNLVNKSLLRRLPSGRYEVHELLRQYGAERLAAHADIDAALRAKHTDYYLAWMQRVDELYSEKSVAVMQEIDAEIENVRCAVDSGIYTRKPELLDAMLPTLFTYYEVRGLYQEAIATFERIEADFDRAEHPRLYQKTIQRHGIILQRLSRYADSEPLLSESLAMVQTLGDIREEVWARVWLSYTYMHLGDYENARQLGEQAVVCSRGCKIDIYVSAAVGHLGYVYYLIGNHERASALMEEGLRLSQSSGSPYTLGYAHNNYGEVLRALGRYYEAADHFREGLRLFTEVGYRRGIAFAVNNLGGLVQGMGDYAEAERMYRKSYKLNKQIGDRTGMGHSISALGSVAFYQGHYEDAKGHYEQSLALRRELNDQRGIADSLFDLGFVAIHQRRYADGEALLGECRAIRQKLGELAGLVDALNALGELELWRENPQKAREYFVEAQRIGVGENLDFFTRVMTRLGVAAADLELGRYPEAQAALVGLESVATQIEVAWGRAWGGGLVALAALGLGDLQAATEESQINLRLSVDAQHQLTLDLGLTVAALLQARLGNPQQALRLLAPTLKGDWGPRFVVAYLVGKRLLPELQAALPSDEFALLMAQNENRPLIDAAADYLHKFALA